MNARHDTSCSVATLYTLPRAFLASHFLFVSQVREGSGKQTNLLQMQSVDIVNQSEPLKKFKVSFVIERPESS